MKKTVGISNFPQLLINDETNSESHPLKR